MGFSTGKNKTTAAPSSSTPKGGERAPATKPDFILKVKGEDGKFLRIAGMWGPSEQGSFRITFDEDIEFKSTADDRVKAVAFPNDGEAKFGKRK